MDLQNYIRDLTVDLLKISYLSQTDKKRNFRFLLKKTSQARVKELISDLF